MLKKLKWFLSLNIHHASQDTYQFVVTKNDTDNKTMATTTTICSNNNNNNSIIKTYRHEFGKEFMLMLSMFSKVHQYDDRHMYKSEWAKWVQQENIAQAIDMEKRRLQENGYIGDIDDKMFKAGRYYFRKKTIATAATTVTASAISGERVNDNKEQQQQVIEKDNIADHQDDDDDNDNEDDRAKKNNESKKTAASNEEQSQQRQRRPYITMSKETIRLMDDHIKNMHSAATTVQFKPSSCYDEFYQTKMSSCEMTREIEKIIQKYQKNAGTTNISPDELTTEIVDKIKKTYKNRYYKFVSSCNI